MRGEVLHYDDDSGTGFISGAGGARYAFERGDLRRLVPIAKGTLVEFQPDGERAREIFTILALGILAVALIIPSISVMVRRQHDIGLSGWFYLLVFLPSIGSIILFVFSLIPSQAHDNKWGPVPFGVRVPSPFTPPAPGT